MTVQYKAKAITKIGGGGSGSLNTGANGPTKISLTGYKMAAKFFFQAENL
jgi:hypothetical protein